MQIPANDPNFMDIDNLPPGGIHTYLLPDGKTFVLTKEFTIMTTLGTITIPPGFMTDGPSIPERLRSVVTVLGKHFFPAVLHDWWYRVIWARKVSTGNRQDGSVVRVTKEMADNIFRQEMADLNVPWWRRSLMWLAVHVGGEDSWRT